VTDPGDLGTLWEEHARDAIAWFRTPGHDSYWRYHRDQFLEILPPPGKRTFDVGCGEGRLSRDLKALGHKVAGCDTSQTMIEAARKADPSIDFWRGPASGLPAADGAADLIVAFMCLQDMTDVVDTIREAHRVLAPGGHFCFAIVHPLNSAGKFECGDAESPFVIRGTYLGCYRYRDFVEREGLSMVFESEHRPIGWYFDALATAGFLVEQLRETNIPDSELVLPRSARWQRLPLFLHVRALRP
jgi:SAM-dependent methyltransferase